MPATEARPRLGWPAGGAGRTLSREAALYLALLALAACLRWFDLAWMPLDPSEAALAWPAWDAAQGAGAAPIAGAPLFFHLERLLLWLRDSDAAARSTAALAGLGLVAGAASLRPALGRSAALVAAALFALAPLWVFLSRTVSPATLSALVLVLLLGALTGGLPWARTLVPTLAALGLAAGGPAFAAYAAGAWVLLALGLARRGWPGPPLWPDARARLTALAVFAVTLVLAATGLFSRLDGAPALLAAPRDWLLQVRLGVASGLAWEGFLLPLLVYAPLTVGAGVLGIGLAIRRGDGLGTFLAVWALLAWLVGLLAGSPRAVPELLLPLTLCAAPVLALLAARVFEGARASEDGVMLGIVLVVLVYALIRLWSLAWAGPDLTDRTSGLGALVLAGILVLLFALVWGRDLALRVGGLALVLSLAFLAWSNGVRLNYLAESRLREPMRPAWVAPGAAYLAAELAEASLRARGDPLALATSVDPSLRPALAWPLRQRSDLRWVAARDAERSSAIVLPRDSVPVDLTEGAIPRTHEVAGRWEPGFADADAFWRWYLARQPRGGGPGAPELSWASLYPPP